MTFCQAFEKVALYAVDSPEYSEPNEETSGLPLNRSVFCTTLYVSRPDLETEVREHLTGRMFPVYLAGHCGAGKTSLLNRVLDDLEAELKGLIFRIDFKTIPDLDEVCRGKEGDALRAAIEERFYRELRTRLDRFVDERRDHLTWDNIVSTLVRDARPYEVEPSVMDAKTELVTMYQRSMNSTVDGRIGYDEWLAREVRERQVRVLDIFDALRQKLSPKAILCGLTKILGVPRAILAFDNVDSISTIGLRDTVRNFVRDYPGHVGGFARILVAIRPENEARVAPVAFTGDEYNRIAVNQPTDFRARLAYDIAVDPTAQNSVSGAAKNGNIAKLKGVGQEQVSIDHEIMSRRITYLNECITRGDTKIIDQNRLDGVMQRCELVAKQRHVQDTLSKLANYDKRHLLVTLSNFVDYLEKQVGLPAFNGETGRACEPRTSDTKDALDEFSYLVESHFYLFSVGRTQGWSYGRIFDTDVYNIIQWVNEWRRHRSALRCMAPHLVLAAVYNETAHTGPRKTHGRVFTKQIMDPCLRVGISTETVCHYLREYCRGYPSTWRFTETTRNYDESFDWNLQPGDEHALMPLGCIMLEVVGLKFHYLMGMMDRQQFVTADNRRFSYDSASLFLPSAIWEVLRLISELGEMELNLLLEIRSNYGIKDRRWITEFQQTFCISPKEDYTLSENRTYMLTDSMLDSCGKFLRTINQRGFFGNAVTQAMVNEYSNLRTEFNKLVVAIADGAAPGQGQLQLRNLIRREAFR